MTDYTLVHKHDGDLKGEPLFAASVFAVIVKGNAKALTRAARRAGDKELWEIDDHIFTQCLYAPNYEKEWALGNRNEDGGHTVR